MEQQYMNMIHDRNMDIPNAEIRVEFFLRAVITGEMLDLTPINSTEEYLYAIATGDGSRLSDLGSPRTLLETYLSALQTGDASSIPTPITRSEMFLYAGMTGEDFGIIPETNMEKYLKLLSEFGGVDYLLSTSENGSVITLPNSKSGIGYINELKGNTLVNLASIKSIYENTNLTTYYVDETLCETASLKLNTMYTLIVEKEFLDGHSTSYDSVQLGLGNSIGHTIAHPTMASGSYSMNYNTNKYETKIATLSFADFKGYKYLSIRPCRRSTSPIEGEVGKYRIKVILLEDDWTNKEIPNGHFEGIGSVGQDGITMNSKNQELVNARYEGNFLTIPHPESHLDYDGKVDVACEGNTLVNLAKKTNIGLGYDSVKPTALTGSNYNGAIATNIKPSTKYTVIRTKPSVRFTVASSSEPIVNGTICSNIYGTFSDATSSPLIATITTLSDTKELCVYVDNANDKSCEVLILEGESQEIPPHFEGMKSVGELEGNKVEISSVGKNLLGKDFAEHIKATVPNSVLNEVDKTIKFNGSDVVGKVISKIKFGEGQYTFILKGNNTNPTSQSTNISIRYTDGTSVTIPNFVDGITRYTSNATKNIEHLVGTWGSQATILYYEECAIIKGADMSYTPYQNNRKEIQLSAPLRGLPNGVKDRFVKRDGKWYTERKCEYATLKGEEEYYFYGANSLGTHYRLGIKATPTIIGKFDGKIICDKVPSNGANANLETIYMHGSSPHIFQLVLPKEKLSSYDMQGFITWLKSNNLKVAYELANPTYELITDPTLLTYLDITHISNNSTIPCNMVVDVMKGDRNVPYKENTKVVNLDEPLRGLPNGVTDRVVYLEGKNLFDEWSKGKLMPDGSFAPDASGTDVTSNFMKVISGKTYTCSNSGIGRTTHFYFYDINKNLVYRSSSESPPSSIVAPIGASFLRVYGLNTDRDKFMVEKSTTPTTYEPYAPEGKGTYFEKNCGEVVLDGSENWIANDNTLPNTLRFQLSIADLKPLPNTYVHNICDKFPCYPNNQWGIDKEMLEQGHINDNKISIRILRAKLATQNLDGFKQWLQANPTKVAYKLVTPTLTKMSSLPFTSYDDETIVTLDTTIPHNGVVMRYPYSTDLRMRR